jgi:hypothetical protein
MLFSILSYIQADARKSREDAGKALEAATAALKAAEQARDNTAKLLKLRLAQGRPARHERS